MNEKITTFFPDLQPGQLAKLDALENLYREWNSKINVISRKDIDHFFTHHLLHSLSIARIFRFIPGIRIMDAGTGGGFPGVPLAIFFPEVQFFLVDSITKKIKVIEAIKEELKIDNIETRNLRYESCNEQFDFILGRAVSGFDQFYISVRKNILKNSQIPTLSGVLYLTGGIDPTSLKSSEYEAKIWKLSDYFSDPYFETKQLIHGFPLSRVSKLKPLKTIGKKS
jgi:16S rRNA (guanine527-N7)-methyltransferase